MPGMRFPPAFLTAALLGALLGLCGLPQDWSFVSALPLAALLLHAARADTPRQVGGRMWWGAAAYFAAQLWWLAPFLAKIFGFAPMGALALLLFALEGAFMAAMAWLLTRLNPGTLGRVWLLAGGWVLVEALRFLGPLAFPWPTLGYTLLPTPMIQVADLGGVMLGSVLVAATAAALVSFWHDRRAPLILMSVAWIAAISYGVTRTPAPGPVGQALLLRTEIDSFGRASRKLTPQEQFEVQLRLTAARRPGEVPIWFEGALQSPALLPLAPAGGIYGVSGYPTPTNRAVAWDGARITSQNDKARPVPGGEYYPLRRPLAPVWDAIERAVNISLESVPAATDLRPLDLNGTLYGAYICYDSVFPWVARQLTREGAQVLVNISNDGWFVAAGTQQHEQMGRVRAIESRRWVLRSVNEGTAAVIDDLGRSRQSLSRGEGVIHARYRLLNIQTPYQRVGDWPAVLLAIGMIGYGAARGRRLT